MFRRHAGRGGVLQQACSAALRVCEYCSGMQQEQYIVFLYELSRPGLRETPAAMARPRISRHRLQLMVGVPPWLRLKKNVRCPNGPCVCKRGECCFGLLPRLRPVFVGKGATRRCKARTSLLIRRRDLQNVNADEMCISMHLDSVHTGGAVTSIQPCSRQNNMENTTGEQRLWRKHT